MSKVQFISDRLASAGVFKPHICLRGEDNFVNIRFFLFQSFGNYYVHVLNYKDWQSDVDEVADLRHYDT